jgi:hypothetical protein
MTSKHKRATPETRHKNHQAHGNMQITKLDTANIYIGGSFNVALGERDTQLTVFQSGPTLGTKILFLMDL